MKTLAKYLIALLISASASLYLPGCEDDNTPVNGPGKVITDHSSIRVFSYPHDISDFEYKKTSDGGFVGSNVGNYYGFYKFSVTKFSNQFSHEWTISYTDSSYYLSAEALECSSGYWIAGSRNRDASHRNPVLAKIDRYGTPLSYKIVDQQYEGYFLSAGMLIDGSMMVSFGINVYPVSLHSCLMRLDADGNVIWCKTCNYGFFRIIGAKDGGALGFTISSDGIIAVKFDPDGNVLWAKYYLNSLGRIDLLDVLQTESGGLVYCGRIGSTYSGSSFTLKTDNTGNIITYTDYSYGYSLQLFSCSKADSGRYVYSGTSYSTQTAGNAAIIILADSLGNVIWNKIYDNNGIENFHYVQSSEHGRFWAMGPSSVLGYYYDKAAVDIGPDGFICSGTGKVNVLVRNGSYTIEDVQVLTDTFSVTMTSGVLSSTPVTPAVTTICSQ